MIISIHIKERSFNFDTNQVKDISIPLKFDGEQPSMYGVEKAEAVAYQDGGFVGDTRLGGACNFEKLTLTPHCNGTHTECVGHITLDRISVQQQLKDSLMPATLITVMPEKALVSTDTYDPDKNPGDLFITAASLKKALRSVSKDFLVSLVIRTIPNTTSKMSQDYLEKDPAFFSLEAMKYIVELGVKHLLVDLPSVDRSDDDGKLNAHRIFWNVETGSLESSMGAYINKSITELIYVREEIEDGSYLLNLQIAPFVSDAAPSRPLLYPLIPTSEFQ